MITFAGLAHAGVMAFIHRHAFPSEAAWDEAAIATQLKMPGSFGLLADNGFLLARAVAGEAEILTFAVMPQARRQGIGRALLGAFLQAAQSYGAAGAFLEVAEDNAAARALYAGFGARMVGRRRGYYPGGTDALVLHIDIGLKPCGSPHA